MDATDVAMPSAGATGPMGGGLETPSSDHHPQPPRLCLRLPFRVAAPAVLRSPFSQQRPSRPGSGRGGPGGRGRSGARATVESLNWNEGDDGLEGTPIMI